MRFSLVVGLCIISLAFSSRPPRPPSLETTSRGAAELLGETFSNSYEEHTKEAYRHHDKYAKLALTKDPKTKQYYVTQNEETPARQAARRKAQQVRLEALKFAQLNHKLSENFRNVKATQKYRPQYDQNGNVILEEPSVTRTQGDIIRQDPVLNEKSRKAILLGKSPRRPGIRPSTASKRLAGERSSRAPHTDSPPSKRIKDRKDGPESPEQAKSLRR